MGYSVLANIREAIELCLEDDPAAGEDTTYGSAMMTAEP